MTTITPFHGKHSQKATEEVKGEHLHRFEVSHGAEDDVFWVVTLCGICRYTNVSEKHVFICSLALKMETLCFSETLVTTYKSTWCYNPENHINIFIDLLS
jgi:hypothetical protein